MRFIDEFREKWALSVKEFRRLQTITVCGIMAALAVVLSFVGTIRVGQFIRIGLSGIPERMANYLFGPAVGAVLGGVLDFLEYLVNPSGAYFPGFTLSAVLTGLIYGCCLYRRKITLAAVLIPEILVRVFVNLLLNTWWLAIMYGQGFLALLPSRILSNVLQLPAETILIFLVLKATARVTSGMLRTE